MKFVICIMIQKLKKCLTCFCSVSMATITPFAGNTQPLKIETLRLKKKAKKNCMKNFRVTCMILCNTCVNVCMDTGNFVYIVASMSYMSPTEKGTDALKHE